MQIPQFEMPLLLDLLFAVVILLFVPFGIRRGVAREAFVSAALLLSGLVANAWGPAWGDWIAAAVGLDASVARFVVTMLILLVGLAVLGWGSGGLVPRAPTSLASRLVGGLLAAFNAAYLLSLVLSAYERDLGSGAEVSGTVIGGELLRDLNRLMLAAAVVLLVCGLFGWLVRGRTDVGGPVVIGGPAPASPVGGTYGYETAKQEPAASGAPVPRLAETAPLPSARPSEDTDGAWWRPPSPGPPTNGHTADAGGLDAHGTAPSGGSSWQQWRDQAYGKTVELPSSEGGRRFGGASTAGADDRERCPTCGARVSGGDLFCPSCGKTL